MNYILKIINSFFASVCFSGKIKYMPGTFGSIVSFAFIILLDSYFNLFFLLILSIIVAFITIRIESKILNSHDHKSIVIDEFIGVLICFIYGKQNSISINNQIILVILFRFFDILKPFPIRYIDKNIKNSFGIIFDDVLASVFSITSFQILKIFCII